MTRSLILLTLSFLLPLLSCSPKTTGKTTQETTTLAPGLYEGYVLIDSRVRIFTPCGSERPLWLDVVGDELRDAYNANRSEEDYAQVYMLVEGEMRASRADPYGQSLTVTTVLEARPNSPENCPLDTPGFFEATGNEPGWKLTINPDEKVIHLLYNYGEQQATFPYTTPIRWGNNWTYYSNNLSNGPIVIETYRENCSDGMSDFQYTDKVVVKMKDGVWQGCGGKKITGRK